MICDWVNITAPETVANDVMRELQTVLHAVGAIAATDELWNLAGGSGSFMHKRKKNFSIFGVSGQVLDALRSQNLLEDFFVPFVGVPHSVTRIDIAHDIERDSPKELRRIYKKATNGEISLSRKTLRGGQVRRLVSPGTWGDETGTVYLGRPTAEIRARIYDKRQEVFDKHGIELPCPLTRYELTLTSKTGIGLSDVFSPEAAFWNFMGDVLPKPANAPVWETTGAGFDLVATKELLPAELLKRKVGDSLEVGKLLDLAEQQIESCSFCQELYS